jgi:type IV pilus assembly protein PilQ
VQTSTGPAVAIDTQEVSTQVLVNNSETIVLGGIFQQNTAEVVTQVPFFGKLPLVGKLFRSKQRLREKRELLIFVTSQILEEN